MQSKKNISTLNKINNIGTALLSQRVLDINGRITEGDYCGISSIIKDFENDYIKDSKLDTINVNINSISGDYDTGMAIYHALKFSNLKVHTRITGMSGEIASVIFLAGDERTMFPHSYFSLFNYGLHDPDVKEFEQYCEMHSDKLGKIYCINEIVRNKTKLEEDVIVDMLFDRNIEIDAQKAMEYGITTMEYYEMM